MRRVGTRRWRHAGSLAALLAGAALIAACGPGDSIEWSVGGGGTTPSATITSQGTEFYLTFPDHVCVSDPGSCLNAAVTNKLIVAAVTATSGQVVFNGVPTPFSVPAGGQIVISLDPGVVLTANEMVETKGIHVTALDSISIHAISETQNSADGYLALPVSSLGIEYFIMSRTHSIPAFTGSEFAIVATQNSTIVTIVSKAAGANQQAGVPFNVPLDAGQTYQLQNPANGDMSGSAVTATKPIAVFGGHRCVTVPSTFDHCDYLVEQIPDVTRLGKKFRTVPFSGRTRYSVRIVGTVNGTSIAYDPALAIAVCDTVNAGDVCDLPILTGGQEIVADQPLMVAQFMHGGTDGAIQMGDPSMVMVTPEEQALTDMTFGVSALAGTSGASAHINIVAPTASLGSLTLDGVAVNPLLFSPIGALGFSGGTVAAAPGAHTLRAAAPFTALVYDAGDQQKFVSYAYPAATGLSVIAP